MNVCTGSTLRRISLSGLRSSTSGGGFANSPYLNSLQMAVGTQAVPANPLYILQPCARGDCQPNVTSKNQANSSRSQDC